MTGTSAGWQKTETPGERAVKKTQGFTLIEILVVMLIISITAGVAVITLSTNQHNLSRSTATDIMRALELAETESLLKPAILSFSLTPCGWRFEIFTSEDKQPDAWHPLTGQALSGRCIPERLRLRLSAKGNRILITPGGDITPFTLLIGKKNAAPEWRITGKASGDIQMEPFHAE